MVKGVGVEGEDDDAGRWRVDGGDIGQGKSINVIENKAKREQKLQRKDGNGNGRMRPQG